MKNLSHSQKKALYEIVCGGALFVLYYIINALTNPHPAVAIGILTVAYLVLGHKVMLSALRNITRGKLMDENFLMFIATVGAYVLGDYAEAVAVMLFYQVGELFQDYAVDKSRRSIKELMDICPEYANIECDGKLTEVSPWDVNIGDIIVVKPGERIPLDGIVTEGKSSIDTSSLTGESLARSVGEGDEVLSGCINMKGVLRLKVTKSFDNSTVSGIMELVENSAFSKSRSERFITRFARVYTPAVVICAAALAIVPPILFGGFAKWFKSALVFLVISCPCALVVSVPMTFFSALGSASKKGILIKGSNYLELMGKAKAVVFDKTGTLTIGEFGIQSVCPSSDCDEKTLLWAVSCCEHYSDHPLADAIRSAGAQYDADELSDFVNHDGMGVTVIASDKRLSAGNAALMEHLCIDYIPADDRGTVIYVGMDDKYLGCLILGDRVKPEAACVMSKLREWGVSTTILTGDNSATAEAVCASVGADKVYGELLPQDKISEFNNIKTNLPPKRTAVFVGDGINDAPVLALADVGIAMGSLGSDAAIEAADIVIMNDNLNKICEAMNICRKTMSIVWQNVIFSLGVKFAVMVLGVLGFANMWLAVFADVGVAFIAVLNAMRAMKYE